MQESETSTRAAIQRSKQFLETKLKPDLEEARSFLSHLQQCQNDYIVLQRALDNRLQASNEKDRDGILALLGQGVHIQAEIEPEPLIIVSSGLRASPQDWQTDSGLYLQLTELESAKFAERKIDILNRWGKMIVERSESGSLTWQTTLQTHKAGRGKSGFDTKSFRVGEHLIEKVNCCIHHH